MHNHMQMVYFIYPKSKLSDKSLYGTTYN